MKQRLSKLALLAVAAAFIVAGFPACSDEEEPDPPAQATATFAGVEIPEGGLALTAGEPKDDVTATLTVANTAFSDAVKDLEVGASLADYITLSAGEKVSVAAKLAEKVEGNTMKITLSVTADADAEAGTGEIKATLKAAALTAAKDVAATGAISYTVKAADPDAPKATFVGDAGELTKGEAKPVTATVTMTQGTFAETIAAEQFALKATDSKVTVTVTAATKTSATAATLTLSVTAADGATNGRITATVKAEALADYDKAIAASGTIAYTVKDDDKTENPPDSDAGTFTLTEASATISLGKKNVGTIASTPNAGGKGYLSAATDNWGSSQTIGEFTDVFYNLSGNRSLTLTVKNVAGFKLYVKNSTAGRTFTVKIGEADAITITHPASQFVEETQTDVIPFIFNTGTTEEVSIVIGGGSNSVYPAYAVVYASAQDIPVEKVEITNVPSSAVLLAEGTVQLGATVSPDRATNKSLTWTSSDNDIATVDNNGLVTLKAAGTVTITAKTTNRKDEAEITIQAAAVAVSGIAVADSDGTTSGTMKVGKTRALTATVSPNDASNKVVVWSSSNENIATVKDGVVTAVAAGTVSIKATAAADSNVSAEYTLTVEASNEVKVWLGTGTPDKNSLNKKLSKVDAKFVTHSDVSIGDIATNDFVGSVKLHICKLDSNGPNLYTKGKNADDTEPADVDIDNDYVEFEVKKECTVSFTSVGNPASLRDPEGGEIETQSAVGDFSKQLSAGTYRIYGTSSGGACKIKYIAFE